MRLISLEVSNVRGICGFPLRCEGNNALICGPNGSGKSAVVDALDFLFSGQISRLTGVGTEGISLARHGPHVLHTPSEARVTAIVTLPGQAKRIEISRAMSQPETLVCSDGDSRPLLNRSLAMASRGQHVLTRRDILRFITTTANNRGVQIQELLNLQIVEQTRLALVGTANRLALSSRQARMDVRDAEVGLARFAGATVYDAGNVLSHVNSLRRRLGAPGATSLDSRSIVEGIAARPAPLAGPDLRAVPSSLEVLTSAVGADAASSASDAHRALRSSIEEVMSDPRVVSDLYLVELAQRGIGLIDDSGACPLCEQPWPPGELRRRLQERIDRVSAASAVVSRVNVLAEGQSVRVLAILNAITVLLEAPALLLSQRARELLEQWAANCRTVQQALESPVDSYLQVPFDDAQAAGLFAPPNASSVLTEIGQSGPARTAYQSDPLTELIEVHHEVKRLEDAGRAEQAAQRTEAIGKLLRDKFVMARDQVLGSLYDEIRDRFVSFYRQLHPDEDEFGATIKSHGPGIDFTVDFYGRGEHLPQALHSEGHQDSMGLCLYLALTERLAAGYLDLVVLDDVVTSIDAGHRRAICTLLRSNFPNRQFLITTHDEHWARFLRTEGIVRKNAVTRFYDWRITAGPRWDTGVDTWDRIEEDLAEDRVPDAAHKLRRMLEAHFVEACERLRARVLCRPDAKWELGDLMWPAAEQLGKLLGKARHAALSWSQQDRAEQSEVLRKDLNSLIEKCKLEQWVVNSNVHFTNWVNSSVQDFRPTLSDYRRLHELFLCSDPNCAGYLEVVRDDDQNESAVKCPCGKTTWNLAPK